MQIAITLDLFLPKILKMLCMIIPYRYISWIAYNAEFILQKYLQYQNSQKKLS